jgi:hypothetical protein
VGVILKIDFYFIKARSGYKVRNFPLLRKDIGVLRYLSRRGAVPYLKNKHISHGKSRQAQHL